MADGAYDLAANVTARLAGLEAYGVYRGTIPTTPPGAYVVLNFGGGNSFSTRLDSGPREFRWSFRALCAGYSEEQTLNTVDLVRFRLAGWRPDPNNPGAGPLNEVRNDPPLIRDDSVSGDIRFSVTLQFRLTTNRGYVSPDYAPSGLVEVGHGPPTALIGGYYLDLDNGKLYEFSEGP